MQSMELANWCVIPTWTFYVAFEHTPQKRMCRAQASEDLLASPGCWLSHPLQQQALGQSNSLAAFCCPFSKRFVPPDEAESLNLPGPQFLYTASSFCVLSCEQHEVPIPCVEMLHLAPRELCFPIMKSMELQLPGASQTCISPQFPSNAIVILEF